MVSNYVRTDGITNLASSVKSAIVPVKKRSVDREQYGAGNYVDSVDSLFVLGRAEINQAFTDLDVNAKLGLGPNKDQVYLAASAMGDKNFRIAAYGDAFLRDSNSNSYGMYCALDGYTGSNNIEKSERKVLPAFCM